MSDESPQQQPPQNPIVEIDASKFLDVIHKYPINGPQTTIDIPIGSEILCAKGMPDGNIFMWVRRPIAEDSPLCSIGVWTFATGQPMPKGESLYYLDTVTLLQMPTILAPGAMPKPFVYHVFVLVDTLLAGEVKIAV